MITVYYTNGFNFSETTTCEVNTYFHSVRIEYMIIEVSIARTCCFTNNNNTGRSSSAQAPKVRRSKVLRQQWTHVYTVCTVVIQENMDLGKKGKITNNLFIYFLQIWVRESQLS